MFLLCIKFVQLDLGAGVQSKHGTWIPVATGHAADPGKCDRDGADAPALTNAVALSRRSTMDDLFNKFRVGFVLRGPRSHLAGQAVSFPRGFAFCRTFRQLSPLLVRS